VANFSPPQKIGAATLRNQTNFCAIGLLAMRSVILLTTLHIACLIGEQHSGLLPEVARRES
jgi:hypothetical protein